MDCFAGARNDATYLQPVFDLTPTLLRHGRGARSELRATSGPSTFLPSMRERTWMPGTRPGMTANCQPHDLTFFSLPREAWGGIRKKMLRSFRSHKKEG